MSAPTKLQPVVKRFPESDWSTGSGVRLPNSDWLKPHSAAITVERPVSVCYKEVYLNCVHSGKWRAGVYER